MDGTFVKELAQQLRTPVVEVTPEGGAQTYVPEGWKRDVLPLYAPEPLKVETLTAVADYLRENRDRLTMDDLMLVLNGPQSVDLMASMDGEDDRYRRKKFVTSTNEGRRFEFGKWLDPEQFMIEVQTKFVDTPGRSEVLSLIGRVGNSDAQEITDDGIAQTVVVKRGVAMLGREQIKNPFAMKPWRTFAEIEQPSSPFVLRLRSNGLGEYPSVGLWECDGGAWRAEAMARVKALLVETCPGVAVIG